jgi:hypothetical protein
MRLTQLYSLQVLSGHLATQLAGVFWLPCRIEALYEHLVSQRGSKPHIAGDAIAVREGAVTRDQMTALACIAEEHMVGYDVQYLPQQAEQMQLDRRV